MFIFPSKVFFFLILQYCISFAIYQNESSTGIHVFPILNPPPSSLPIPYSGSSQCTSPKHPVSCIEPGLAIHFIYDIIHVSMPFSLPSPSCFSVPYQFSYLCSITKSVSSSTLIHLKLDTLFTFLSIFIYNKLLPRESPNKTYRRKIIKVKDLKKILQVYVFQ